MLNAYQLRLKYENKYRLKVASFFGHPVYYGISCNLLISDLSIMNYIKNKTANKNSNHRRLIPINYR